MEILYEMPGFLFEDSYSHQWVRLSMLWEQVSLPVNFNDINFGLLFKILSEFVSNYAVLSKTVQ